MTDHVSRADEAHAARFQPDVLVAYLEARGWEKGDVEERYGAPLWQWMKRRLDAVRVPLRSHYLDYGRCVLGLLKEVAAADGCSTFELVSALEALPPLPVADDVRHEVVQRLLFAMRIYSGHSISHRGPSGCLMDAIEALEPATAQKIRDGVGLSDLMDAGKGDTE